MGGEAPMAKATSTNREGLMLMVGLSFFMAKILVAPTIFLASIYREKERSPTINVSTVEQYLPTVTRRDVCYFSVTLATHLEKNRGPASRHFSM